MASLSVSFNGGVMKIGSLTSFLAGQFGLGVMAFELSFK